jgi:hypothetical protein
MTETSNTTKSIIDPKYKGKKADDWVTGFIDEHVRVPIMRAVDLKDEEGNVVGSEEVDTGKSFVDLDKLFELATINALDASKFEAQRDRPNAPGRIRMSVGNMLRAAAKRRHGLKGLDGKFVTAPGDFVGDAPLKENPDGTKIARKASEDADAETEAA